MTRFRRVSRGVSYRFYRKQICKNSAGQLHDAMKLRVPKTKHIYYGSTACGG